MKHQERFDETPGKGSSETSGLDEILAFRSSGEGSG